jgi:hypothetical protein
MREIDFSTWFKEHKRDVRYNEDIRKHAQHNPDHNHEYGPIESTIDILKESNKEKLCIS